VRLHAKDADAGIAESAIISAYHSQPSASKQLIKEIGMRRILLVAVAASVLVPSAALAQRVDYRVLATNKTSTMEKELNAAAEAGFRFQAVMGGDTAVGGSEVVAVVSRGAEPVGRFAYRLLATSKTSTMEKELQQAADAGFEYRGQTVFKSTFGGEEVVCILERDKESGAERSQYKLIATSRTSTLQKELLEAGSIGYQIVGMTVGKTAMGGNEVVAILRRPRT
jgi:hypothetical protein